MVYLAFNTDFRALSYIFDQKMAQLQNNGIKSKVG